MKQETKRVSCFSSSAQASLSSRWQRLVTRDPMTGHIDPHGEIFASPYRWGATLVLYRTDRMSRWGGIPITDWDDLLLPGLRGRVGCFDSPREFVGIALKTLGMGYNSTISDMKRCGIDENMLLERIKRLAGQVGVDRRWFSPCMRASNSLLS